MLMMVNTFAAQRDVDLFLECLDRAAAKAGFTRGSGREVKSTVRLIGDDATIFMFQEQNK